MRHTKLLFNQSINQSLFYIRQPEPIVARPIHIQRKRAHTTLYKITTQTDEKRETKPLLERDICCRSSHHFSAIFSNRRRTNSLINIVDIDIDTEILLSTPCFKKKHPLILLAIS